MSDDYRFEFSSSYVFFEKDASMEKDNSTYQRQLEITEKKILVNDIPKETV